MRLRERAAAKEDIIRQVIYFTEQAGAEVANRFLAQVEASYTLIAGQPNIGSPLDVAHPLLADMRKWQIKGFENHLIFYIHRRQSISILRVLHVARDWASLLQGV